MLKKINNNISFVTGIWDLDRGSASEGWSRSFDHYINHFTNLLTEMRDFNLVIFIDPSLEDLVWKYREKYNTRIYHHSKEQFQGSFFPFFNKVQKIRKDPAWYNQTGWLKDSTQASLEYYNPMVMSKMFMLHNAKCYDPFGSEYFYWIDGGISNTLSLGYFHNHVVIDNLIKLSKKFLFICFPYESSTEIHGFDIQGMEKYKKFNPNPINRVARGGFFGGSKEYISQANTLYYNLLEDSLNNGYMGTEESIFTLMTYLDPSTYHFETINDDGLIYTFFEKLQQVSFKSANSKIINTYIVTFNSANQLQMVLDSFEKYEKDILESTNIVLINNSTNQDLFSQYDSICSKYNIVEIHKDNIGICGARQYAAEHFDKSIANYMLFFEDDMLLDYNGNCKFGFSKQTNNLLDNLLDIMQKENYDFIKFSFSEFYGHNGEQWSWHNVPINLKLEYFGDIEQKPYTLFKNIKSLNGIPYADGEIYYSNWPHIINKEGNRKCFLDTTWQYPYEQTWMSHLYTLTKENKIKPAILLASPITHTRIYHYEKNERKEN